MRALALLIGLTTALSLFADRQSAACLSGEALYMRRSTCNLHFALRDPRPFDPVNTMEQRERLPSGTLESIPTNYEWGFRLAAGYTCASSCWSIRGRYTHVRGRAKRLVESLPGGQNGLWATFGFPRFLGIAFYGGIAPVPESLQFRVATAMRDSKWHYDAADFQAAWHLPWRCLPLQLSLGLTYARIEQKDRAEYTGTEQPVEPIEFLNEIVSVKQEQCSWGIGPQVGVESCLPLVCGLCLRASFALGSLVFGDESGRFFERVLQTTLSDPPQVERDLSMNPAYPGQFHLIPEWNGRAGLSYCLRCGHCLQLGVEVGYEFVTYFNAVSTLGFNDAGGTLNDNCYHFGLSGFYFQGAVSF